MPLFSFLYGAIPTHGLGNPFTGSATLHKNQYDANISEFRYRIWIDENDEGERVITACWYVGLYCFEVTDKNEMIFKSFPCDEKEMINISNWLNDAYNSSVIS